MGGLSLRKVKWSDDWPVVLQRRKRNNGGGEWKKDNYYIGIILNWSIYNCCSFITVNHFHKFHPSQKNLKCCLKVFYFLLTTNYVIHHLINGNLRLSSYLVQLAKLANKKLMKGRYDEKRKLFCILHFVFGLIIVFICKRLN